jgi:hypothetical protein
MIALLSRAASVALFVFPVEEATGRELIGGSGVEPNSSCLGGPRSIFGPQRERGPLFGFCNPRREPLIEPRRSVSVDARRLHRASLGKLGARGATSPARMALSPAPDQPSARGFSIRHYGTCRSAGRLLSKTAHTDESHTHMCGVSSRRTAAKSYLGDALLRDRVAFGKSRLRRANA